MSSSPDQNQAERIPGSGLLLVLQEWASNHLDAVAHESPKREALEGHQHPAYLIPREGSAVDHQQRDLPGTVRIPGDAADEMTCVRDPPAKFPSLHVADGESVLLLSGSVGLATIARRLIIRVPLRRAGAPRDDSDRLSS